MYELDLKGNIPRVLGRIAAPIPCRSHELKDAAGQAYQTLLHAQS
jgi:hypothetical protein